MGGGLAILGSLVAFVLAAYLSLGGRERPQSYYKDRPGAVPDDKHRSVLVTGSRDAPPAVALSGAGGTLRPIGKHTHKHLTKDKDDSFSLEETEQKYEHMSKQTCEEKAKSSVDDEGNIIAAVMPLSKVEECGVDDKSLIVLSSAGIYPDAGTQEVFNKLVEKLLENKKEAGETKSEDRLNVLVFYDACMVYESFWNPKHEHRKNAGIMSMIMTDEALDKSVKGIDEMTETEKKRALVLDLVKAKGSGNVLAQSWCYDEAKISTGFGVDIDEDVEAQRHKFEVHQMSIIDRMMTTEEFGLLLKIFEEKDEKKWKEMEEQFWSTFGKLGEREVPDDVMKLIEEADIIAWGGGEPDIGFFAWWYFAQIQKPMLDKIKSGMAIFWGRSSGALLGSADWGLTMEVNQGIYHTLLLNQGGFEGLKLTPTCAVRPHYKQSGWEGFQGSVCTFFEETSGMHVVRALDKQALQCLEGCCFLVGKGENSRGKEFRREEQLTILRELATSMEWDLKATMRKKTLPEIIEVATATRHEKIMDQEAEQESKEVLEREENEAEKMKPVVGSAQADAEEAKEREKMKETEKAMGAEKDKSVAQISLSPRRILVASLLAVLLNKY